MAKVYKKKTWEEKKQEIQDLTSEMEKKIPSYFKSPESIKEYLSFMAKFHQYSTNNSMLIDSQFMGAKAVGSFKFWKEKGFSVKKGEKGIKIIVPKVTTYFKRGDQEVQLKYANKDEKEKIKKQQIETYTRTYFDIGHVFDVSQTDATAKDLPSIFPNRWLEGTVDNYKTVYKALEKVAEVNGIKIVEPYNELGAAKGVSYRKLKEVALNPRNSELQNIKTLVHELAHAVLHTEETHNQYTTQEKEFQAEMVAYTVSSYFGLDTTEYSLPYLNHWTNGKELKDQERLLREVRETAHDFISIIENELVKEREFEASKEQSNDKKFLLVHYQHLSLTEESYITLEQLKAMVQEKDPNQLAKMKELSDSAFLKEFNEYFKRRYAVIDPQLIERPHVLIQWSELEELTSNELIPFGEANWRMEMLEEKYYSEIWYGKTRYHVLMPEESGQINVINMDRLDIGDGDYVNPHHQIRKEKNLDQEQLKLLEKDIIDYLFERESKENSSVLRRDNKVKVLEALER
ncbi:LPD25 domain-containing protein [Pseudobacillus sp. 179-B 2D1 NHS]|uniref:LPD25 domain-containing protein n=1 Tax=Pseudobacillus sp. 179-B 2D1 NHS TaxID=3374292 RepID=UPI00387A272A